MEKIEARKLGIQNRSNLSESKRREKSHQIFLEIQKYIDQADVIGCYVSCKNEVDTTEILSYCWNHKKRVCVPKVTGNTLTFYEIHSFSDLKEGAFHILEPQTSHIVQLEEIECMIVPVVAYDFCHNRCGYGKGFYDSVLKKCNTKIGIAFREQQVMKIECEIHDVVLDRVISA